MPGTGTLMLAGLLYLGAGLGVPHMPMGAAMAQDRMSTPRAAGTTASNGVLYLPLGDIADVKVANGPPMLRDEAGLLVGTSTWTSTQAGATST